MVLAPPASAHHDGSVPSCEDAAGTQAQATCDAALAVIPDPGTLDTIDVPCPPDQTLVDHVCVTPEEPDPGDLPVDQPGSGSGATGAASTFAVENEQTGPVVAGDDLPVAALIYSNCIAGTITTCDDIEVTLSFTTISGEVLTLSQTYNHAPSQRAAFVIPGEHVHWWNTETREPYIFGYWYRATQIQSSVPVEARAPSAPNTMYEREVLNLIDMDIRTEGGMVVGGSWRVELLDLDRTEVGAGALPQSGRLSFNLPSSPPVLAEAETNGGVANFELQIFGDGDRYVAHHFFANFGNRSVWPLATGTSAVDSIEVNEVPPCDLNNDRSSSCVLPLPPVECYKTERNPLGRVPTTILEHHIGYGNYHVAAYEEQAGTAIEIAVKGGGPGGSSWTASGSSYSANPVSGEATWRDRRTTRHARHIEFASKFEVIHTVTQRYPVFDPCPGGNCQCYRTESQRGEDWVPAGRPSDPDYPAPPITIRRESRDANDDCYRTCTIDDAPSIVVNDTNGYAIAAGKTRQFEAGFCWFICVSTTTSYQAENRTIRWEPGASCKWWFLYDVDATEPSDLNGASILQVDSGTEGGGYYELSGQYYPNGCGTLKLST